MTSRLSAALERLVCSCFGTVAYSSLPPHSHGLSDQALGEARRDARYFAISNGIRAGLLVLLVWALRDTHGIVLCMAVLGGAFHALLTWVELYRFRVLRGMEFQGGANVPAAADAPLVHAYFGPHIWESARVYRLLGCEVAKRILRCYQEWARDEGSERLGPKPEPSPSRTGAYLLVVRSRQAEVVHLVGAAYDAVLLWGCLQVSGYWWVLPALGILLDFELVLLQRSHRVRLRRLHRRAIAAGPVVDLEAESP